MAIQCGITKTLKHKITIFQLKHYTTIPVLCQKIRICVSFYKNNSNFTIFINLLKKIDIFGALNVLVNITMLDHPFYLYNKNKK